MPQQIDLVLKNGSNVDKTFAAITPAAGDGGLARWALKEGTISAVFPIVTAMSRKNQNQVRVLSVKFRLPSSYTDTVTGLTNVSSSAEVNIQVTIPQTYPEALKNDFAAFTKNLVANALINSMIRDALPAT